MTSARNAILVVDRDKKAQSIWASVAPNFGLEMIVATTSASAFDALSRNQARIAVFDARTVSNLPLVLTEVAEKYSGARALACSAKPKVSAVVRALRAGAIDFLAKPLNQSEAQTVLERALEVRAKRTGIVPLAELEREAITRAVVELGGNKLLAAKLLGIGKTTLYRKLRDYGIADDDRW